MSWCLPSLLAFLFQALPVQLWDRLVSVNGLRGCSADLIAQACAFGRLKLIFQRPRHFEADMKTIYTYIYT